jgi:hypothetical protein
MKHTLIECTKSEAFVNDACPLFAVYTFYSLLHMQFLVLASNRSSIPAKSLSSHNDPTQIALALVSNALCQSSAKSLDQLQSDAYRS